MMGTHRKTVFLLALIVIGMFGFGFALVPLYNSLCKNLGINGKLTQSYDTAKGSVKERNLHIEFVATQSASIPWAFYPKIPKLSVHPGQNYRLAFYAENKSDTAMTVQAIPSITPAIAAKYLKKTECFCFTQQQLGPHEAMDMPLIFHVDPDLPAGIKTITLSYTLYDVTRHDSNEKPLAIRR